MEAEEMRRNFQNFSRQVVVAWKSKFSRQEAGDISEIGYYFVTEKKEGRKERKREEKRGKETIM